MILGILQARVSSTRLPGKVLKPIVGKPMLLLQIERILRAQKIDRLIVATSTDSSDDSLEELCRTNNIDCYRGSLEDVLERFYQAARAFAPNHVVRLTGDCPLIDPEIIDLVITTHLNEENDYTTNALEPTYPDGLDVEIMRFGCLEQAWREANLKSQREHVTPFIHQQPERFKVGIVKNGTDLSYLRWTVDEPVDFELANHIYNTLYTQNRTFTTNDILEYLSAHPEWQHINGDISRNEGLLKSLAQDSTINTK